MENVQVHEAISLDPIDGSKKFLVNNILFIVFVRAYKSRYESCEYHDKTGLVTVLCECPFILVLEYCCLVLTVVTGPFVTTLCMACNSNISSQQTQGQNCTRFTPCFMVGPLNLT